MIESNTTTTQLRSTGTLLSLGCLEILAFYIDKVVFTLHFKTQNQWKNHIMSIISRSVLKHGDKTRSVTIGLHKKKFCLIVFILHLLSK